MSELIVIQPASLATVDTAADFWQWANIIRDTVAASSARVYGQTYKAWVGYAQAQGFDPLDLHHAHVKAFLQANANTHSTRKRQLSALRVLVRLLADVRPEYKEYAVVINRLKAPAPEQDTVQHERSHHALNPAESDAMLRVWAGDHKPMARRNMAIVATLLLTGMRRAELAALQWRDIDLTRRVIYIRHGKGDKARDAAILGDAAIDALTAWQRVQGQYTHVFTRILKGGKVGADQPMSTQAIQDVISDTASFAELDHVKPHDLRRTLITEMLNTGAPIHEAQKQAGHSNGQTTLRYAQATTAEQRALTTRLRFGAVKVK